MFGPFAGTRVAPDGSDQLIWTLDEATPPFANTGVWGAANLTNNGSPTYNQYGVFGSGKSVKFPGTSNVKLYSPDSIAEIVFPITLSCWVYITTHTTYGIFVTKALATGSWTTPFYTFVLALGDVADGRWQAGVVTGSGTVLHSGYIGASNANLRLVTGVWHHVGLTYDGSYMRYFMDGDFIGKVAGTLALYYGSHGAWMVGDNSNGTNYLNGYVDDIRFASVARNEQWFNDVFTKGWGLDGHLLTGISGASDYYESTKFSRSEEFDATEHLGVSGANIWDSTKFSRSEEFDAEAFGLPGPGFEGVLTYYEHRAWRISTGQYHFWNHTAPDPTGMFSGVSPLDLLDIVIVRTFEA